MFEKLVLQLLLAILKSVNGTTGPNQIEVLENKIKAYLQN